MPKKKVTKKEGVKLEDVVVCAPSMFPPKIQPLTENFSNGELNALKDKINEIISRN